MLSSGDLVMITAQDGARIVVVTVAYSDVVVTAPLS